MSEHKAIETARKNGWDVHTYERDGRLAAYAMVKGSEIHIKVLEEFQYRVIYRVATQEFLRPLFDRFGFLTTRVPLDDNGSRAFVERIGFTKTWEDSTYDYYILTALPFER